MEVQHTFWLCVLCPFLVNGAVVYLSRASNDSIELACLSTASESSSKPYAFYLRRKWLQKDQEVLFVHQGHAPTYINNKADGGRIRVVEALSAGQVNISISRLRGVDTDLYTCGFMVASNPLDREEPGQDEFLLYVADHIEKPCTCSSYPTVLYAISGAVGLLLIITLALSVAYCSKVCCNGSKPQPPAAAVPIYEEMTGLQSGKEGSDKKAFCDQLAGYGESQYAQPRRENPYSNP
ncbi:cd7 antigen-like [Engraulis encrasicolus]|uniref:cd7 antigen-like n=1 Tax=Engraulis encrasicolus TaxID=184585 RepID=UPI002FD4C817